jgi:hypothetical protein
VETLEHRQPPDTQPLAGLGDRVASVSGSQRPHATSLGGWSQHLGCVPRAGGLRGITEGLGDIVQAAVFIAMTG